jgi:hypothetical protein
MKTPLFLFLAVSTVFAAEQAGPSEISSTAPPKSINVKKTCAAKGDGVADDYFAIQRCISRARKGQTIFFPDGTYSLSQTLNLKGNLTVLGQSTKATLRAAEMGNWILMFPKAGANNITLNSLTFEHGPVNLNGAGEIPTNIHITNCKFRNLTRTTSNWQMRNFIYADNGLSHSQIDHNSFYMLLENGATRINDNRDYDGDGARAAIFAFGLTETSIDHNTFDHVYQGIKVCQTFPFQAQNIYIGWNVMTRLHRMGVEIQDSVGCGHAANPKVPINTKNVTIEHNSFTDWDDYYWISFGVSFANAPAANIIVRNNLVVGSEFYQAPGVPAEHTGIGIEVGGRPALVYDNTLRGPWEAAIAVFSGSENSEVHHNYACNLNVNGKVPTIADEMNPSPTNTRYHDNVTVAPCPRDSKPPAKHSDAKAPSTR